MDKSPEQIARERLGQRLARLCHHASKVYSLIEDGDHILIGLSGGKDSLLLTELLGKRSHIYVPRFRVSAVHVRVRERNYLSDVSYLEDFCRSLDVPFHVVDTSIQTPDGTKEKDPCFLCSWYRRKALFDLAQDLGCNKIALGHHRDDILETLLLNMIYQGHFGTIPPKLQMDKMPIQMIRPLCLIDEQDIRTYADLAGYKEQVLLCPFEHASSRAQAKQLMTQLSQLNPNLRDSLWNAMENIKSDYLPNPLSSNH